MQTERANPANLPIEYRRIGPFVEFFEPAQDLLRRRREIGELIAAAALVEGTASEEIADEVLLVDGRILVALP